MFSKQEYSQWNASPTNKSPLKDTRSAQLHVKNQTLCLPGFDTYNALSRHPTNSQYLTQDWLPTCNSEMDTKCDTIAASASISRSDTSLGESIWNTMCSMAATLASRQQK